MLAKLAWVNGHLAALTGPERFVLEAITETPSPLPVTRVIPKALSGLAFGLGRPEEELSRALTGLAGAELLHWDNNTGIALLPELWRSQAFWCQSPNHLRGWFRGWLALPRNSPLTFAALVAVRRLVPLALDTQAFAQAWMQTFARPLYEYLCWGGLDSSEAKRFAAVLTRQEVATLPRKIASGARRQSDFKAKKKGFKTDRELRIEFELALPPEWRAGIAPRFADSGAATGAPAGDLTLARGSGHPEGRNALGAAVRDERLLGEGAHAQPLPVSALDRQRGRDLDPIGLSLYLQKMGNDWVTTDGAGAPNTDRKAESSCGSSSGRSAEAGNDWVTTAEVTTESRLRQSLPSRYRPRAGGSPETQDEMSVKHGEEPGPWAGESEPGSGVRPNGRESVPWYKRKGNGERRVVLQPWYRLISDKAVAKQFADAFGSSDGPDLGPARQEQAAGAGSSPSGRRPRGVAAPPSAGVIAALSGWPKPK